MFFVVYLAVQWWAAWYPGAEPGGGGYIAQRMLACKNEKGALLSSFFFNISHYALRPWPWILIGLVALVVYPELAIHGADAESAYPRAVVDFLPIGLRGMVIASFFAAYMSTISTQLNLGAAYLVNDVYKPFIKKGASEKHYVLVSKLSIILLAVVGGLITYGMRTIVGGWELILAIGAGTGLVYILRWYWWRVNAWSEISAMIASFALAFLKSFYRKVRPAGMWKPISKEVGEIEIQKTIWHDFLDFIFGSGLIFSSLFGIGKLVLGEPIKGVIYLVIAVILFYIIYFHLSRRKWAVLKDK